MSDSQRQTLMGPKPVTDVQTCTYMVRTTNRKVNCSSTAPDQPETNDRLTNRRRSLLQMSLGCVPPQTSTITIDVQLLDEALGSTKLVQPVG